MKKFSFLALAAAGLLFAACSSEKDEVAQVTPDQATQFDQAFVGISIQLPNATTPALTRANDDLNNGEADEFEVKNAYLLLFKGANENDATFLGSWSLENSFEKDDKEALEEPTTTKVTSTSVSVAQISDLSLLPSENLYAYVIVNYNEVSFPTTTTTFSEWKDEQFDAAKIGSVYNSTNMTDNVSAAGLMMTNAPISATAGGSDASSGAVTTAVLLDKSKIAHTKQAAIDAPAGCVYVERSAAKVTIETGTSVVNDLLNPAGTTMAYAIDGFQIINTEPTYYNTRHSDEIKWLSYVSDFCNNANTKYRFVSLFKFSPQLPTPTDHLEAYRTYFGEDPQYDAKATLDNPVATANGNWIAASGRAFVPENTFDVAHQTRENTTQATVRMKLNGGVDFYSITNEATLYSSTGINDAIAAHVQTLNAISTWMLNAKNYVKDALKAADGSKTYDVTVTISATVPTESPTVSLVAGEQSYELTYNITATENGTAITDASRLALSTDLESAWTTATASAKTDYKVTLYKDGLTYYNIRIQHFGEFETPWDAQTDAGVIKIQPGENVAEIYGYTDDATAQEKANKRFLGRYGVVRDNWYKLTIDAIKKLGSATPIPVNGDTTPDDEIEQDYYISCHVHILPWVLRNQSVKF